MTGLSQGSGGGVDFGVTIDWITSPRLKLATFSTKFCITGVLDPSSWDR